MDNLKDMFSSITSIFSPITKFLNSVGLQVTDEMVMVVFIIIVVL